MEFSSPFIVRSRTLRVGFGWTRSLPRLVSVSLSCLQLSREGQKDDSKCTNDNKTLNSSAKISRNFLPRPVYVDGMNLFSSQGLGIKVYWIAFAIGVARARFERGMLHILSLDLVKCKYGRDFSLILLTSSFKVSLSSSPLKLKLRHKYHIYNLCFSELNKCYKYPTYHQLHLLSNISKHLCSKI